MNDVTAAGPSGGALTRSRLECWDTTYLADAAARWRQLAAESEELFEWHRQNVYAPGGSEWSGTASETAGERVSSDAVVVRKQGDIQREASDIAENGCRDIRLAVGQVLEAIAAAEEDGFRVSEDLKVRDTRRIDVTTMGVRHTASREHLEDIRWHCERLMQSEIYLGQRLEGKALELAAVRFSV
ncbi:MULTISPECIES: hypothetical protein [unclassified Mycolicibacterium]|uniref:hypothetical protein n=1 Tax=unclassified Mycolicibacterium TaxID=2636767 RepID=UPI00130719E2|nr:MULTISPECIES: hypothetical protein [unclassified Mycolicibacterium]MUL85309.1 hypothetical protein [Mycolicibacterium sp. CBMA 329]MUL91276.1 hypothetical protein [Mycolicibacterium sp. CBMA 331]MUM02524.1 hypothetical protein [Mycolicibacterium sp. CBMA 334]MUM29304.1 hypothetical protein [Mycolicibacterium sp. CBMA 295]MUM41035.1 hypothetical protein [Mycolicibacterium sp. CBMA 247]